MIEIRIYGHLKKKFEPNAKLSDITKIILPYIENERFFQLLNRLSLNANEIGESFLNHTVVKDTEHTIIPDNARVGIFSQGMFLLCGGQHLKGHGFIKKPGPTNIDYYD